MGIQVLGPDVNESILKFSVDKNKNIRFGLGAVKVSAKPPCRISLKNGGKTVRTKISLILWNVST